MGFILTHPTPDSNKETKVVRQFDSCKIIIIPNVAYVALFLCQIFFLFCCTDVVRCCNIWYNSCI